MSSLLDTVLQTERIFPKLILNKPTTKFNSEKSWQK